MWGKNAVWRRAIRSLTGAFGLAGGIAMLVMTAVVMNEVIGRYFFNSPSLWSFETVQYGMVVIAYLTMCYAVREKSHVTMELIFVRLPKKVRSTLTIVTSTLAVLFWTVLCWQVLGRYAEADLMKSTTGTFLNIPVTYLFGVMVLGCVAALLQAVVEVHDNVHQLATEGEVTYHGA